MDGAIASFERALELDPGNAWASANLGLVLRFTGRYEEALAVHEMAVTMDPLSANAQTRLGTSYWFTGNFELAARHYQIALDLDPSNEEIYDSWSGMLGAGLGRFDEALTMIERKMSLPGEPTVRTLAFAGNLSSLLVMDAAALDYWERGQSANPDYMMIYHGLMEHHLARRDDEAARRLALAVLERAPRDPRALLVLAVLDFDHGGGEGFAGRVRAAYPDWFGDLAGIDRTDADVALLVALAYEAEGRGGERERVLEAMEATIDRPRASEHLLLAAAQAMHHRPEAALRYLRSSPPGRVRLWSDVMLRDPRFALLHDDAGFRALVAEHLEALRRQGQDRAARLAAE
jgi:tetratricopeptide (TPR) repeat protein